jgi:hypothetical protein
MDISVVLPAVFMGLYKGMDFGHNRALELQRFKPTLSEADQATLAVAVILSIVLFLASPEPLMVLLLGAAWLSFLVAYVLSAALAFQITRHLVKNRSSL